MKTLLEDVDPEHVGLLREILQVIFGLDPNTINKVTDRIRTSKNAANVKTNIVRVRIGARAMKFLRNSIEIARHEGSEKHETGREFDLQKLQDLAPDQLSQEQQREKAEKEKVKMKNSKNDDIKENQTFKEYLVNEREMTISIDPTDPNATKQAINMARQNPERSERMGMIQAKQDKETAQQEGDALAARIASLRMQLKQLEARHARLQGQQGAGQ